MKTLKQLLKREQPQAPSNVVSKGDKAFWNKHEVEKVDDANGNEDDVFKASNIKFADRHPTHHGYNPGEDDTKYESRQLRDILAEKKLTSAEMKKREEIAQAMERENPGMDMGKKMAIATAQAKKVAEESDLFAPFAEEVRADVQTVYDLLDEANKQLMIELIEAQEYDVVVDITKETMNG